MYDISFVDIEATKSQYGYDFNDLNPNSHRLVIVKCEFCLISKSIQRRYCINGKKYACRACHGVSRNYKKLNSPIDPHDFWLINRPKLNLTAIDIEQSKIKFGYTDINLESKTNRKIIAKCEFCQRDFITTLISIHKSQKYICCFSCAPIASRFSMDDHGLEKHDYFVWFIERRTKLLESRPLCQSKIPNSEEVVELNCEFCLKKLHKPVRYLYHKSGHLACRSCAWCAIEFNKISNGITKHEFWKIRQSKINLQYVDFESTKQKYGYDPSNLTHGSQKFIIVRCYFCGDNTTSVFNYFVKRECRKTCQKCKYRRNVETLQQRYGVSNAMEIDSVQDKLNNPITEQIVQSLLRDVYKVEFIRNFHVPIIDDKFYSFDFFIPSINLLIECQGDFFHNFKLNGYSGTPRDRSKATFIELHTSYKLVHIWEHEIHLGRIRKILNYHIYGVHDGDIKIDSLKDLKFNTVESSVAHTFLSSYHYLGNLGTVSVCYGAFYNDVLVCICTFGGATRQNTFKKVNRELQQNFSPKQLKELRRFCIKPGVQAKRMASYCIRRFLSHYIMDFPQTRAVISFADPTVGDSGSIYNYAGWKQLSDTSQSYHYLDPKTNQMLHKKTIWDLAIDAHMKEQNFADKLGLIRVNELPKHMWIKVF